MQPIIKTITSWQKTDETFFAPGALVEVINGKGLLREDFKELMNGKSYCTLMLGDTPLFQLQGGEYYCPTCEKIMKSGYNLEQSAEFYNQVINATKEGVSFEEALESVKPLLGLLPSKYYIVLDTRLYPTDGNGHLFWETTNEDVALPGTCIYYFQEKGYTWGKCRPSFTVATQPIEKLSTERVEYYRNMSGARAIAYYMDGYMTALLDGHHKAMAAALEGQMVNALVIVPCVEMRRCEDKVIKNYIDACGMDFACEEYGITLPENKPYQRPDEGKRWMELQRIQSQIPQAPLHISLPYDTKKMVKPYPDVRALAYMDLVGEIENERLDHILAEQEYLSVEEATDMIEALSGMRHERLWEVVDFYLDRRMGWSGVPRELVETCFRVLVKLPHTEELDAYLIERMVEFEDEYPIVKSIVMLDYFE